MITGLRTSVLIPAAKKAPAEDPARAASPMRTAVFTSTGALRAYVTAAPVVPTVATALLVPSACAAGVFAGSTGSSTGSSRRPPPPTTASIQPAARAATQSRTITVSDMSGLIATHARPVRYRCGAGATPLTAAVAARQEPSHPSPPPAEGSVPRGKQR